MLLQKQSRFQSFYVIAISIKLINQNFNADPSSETGNFIYDV